MIAAQAPAPEAAATPTTKAPPAGTPSLRVAGPATPVGGALLQRCAACGTPRRSVAAGAGDDGGACACGATATVATAKAPQPDSNDPLAGMLARAVAQRAEAAAPAADAPPHYKGSETEAPGVRDPDKALEYARQLAIGYVEAARQALREIIAGEVEDAYLYSEAMSRHFLSATPDQQVAILKAYDRIADTLKVDNYVVTRGRTAVDGNRNPCKDTLAYWRDRDDLVYLCPMFWQLSPFCRAITLIHEGAHDADVDKHIAGHQSGRGGAMYPKAGEEEMQGPDKATTAERHSNPDVYAFFAAHIAAGADRTQTCGRPKGKGKRK